MLLSPANGLAEKTLTKNRWMLARSSLLFLHRRHFQVDFPVWRDNMRHD
jgi:hypothetical protein